MWNDSREACRLMMSTSDDTYPVYACLHDVYMKFYTTDLMYGSFLASRSFRLVLSATAFPPLLSLEMDIRRSSEGRRPPEEAINLYWLDWFTTHDFVESPLPNNTLIFGTFNFTYKFPSLFFGNGFFSTASCRTVL